MKNYEGMESTGTNTHTRQSIAVPTWDDLRHGPPVRPLWPDIGQALNLGRSATYAAAARGEIPCVRIGGRVLGMVPALLRMLGDDQ